ncbi:MAG: hypothetical protein E6J90_47460 [Deltaproteobacteria bacterium]|nr:MAG: hypothetical protein E6J90_47460 [Deltaproteobacteria bacterium]TMQ11667.1 MAG: hypothetical protein E6J91_22275 [Deltaproteobacteria bacterium]
MRLTSWFPFALVLSAACGHPAVPSHVVSNTQPQPPPAARPTNGALHAWPVAPFSPSQIAEATGCQVEKLATARYAKGLAVDALPGAFAVHGTCDQAVLAAACAVRLEDAAPPAACLDAYRAAVQANPAFAFVSVLPGGYFGKVPLVAAPPAAGHALVSAALDYQWGGLGTPVAWQLAIRDAATSPAVSVTGPNAKATKSTPDLRDKIAALGTSLDSFLPIPEPLHAVDCTDNYPKWTATLEFDDREKLELTTHDSNLLGIGGPWQITIDGVTYLQLAPGFAHAVAQLVSALDLPLGEPAGQMCRGYDIASAVLVPRTK